MVRVISNAMIKVYFELLDTYVRNGGWCIDTARVYCDWLENGHNSSEGVIGRWMKARATVISWCLPQRAVTLQWDTWIRTGSAGKTLKKI